MKNYLIIVCGALAIVGCAHNRGGTGEDSQRQTGYDRNYKMPKSSESVDAPATSSTNSISSTNTIERSEDYQIQNTPPPQN